MFAKLWAVLDTLDAGVKVALALFVASALLLGLTAPEDETRPARTAADGEAREKPARAKKEGPAHAKNKRAKVPDATYRFVETGLIRLGVATMDFALGHPMDVEEAGGELFVVDRDGLLTWYDRELRAFVPVSAVEMNRDAIYDSPIGAMENFKGRHFRTFGLMVRHDGDRFRAYVAHHAFADDCFHFKVSVIRFEIGDEPEVEGDPELLYQARPCIPPNTLWGSAFRGNQAGGRMVPIDDDRFLISIGDHSLDGLGAEAKPLDPESPYGKIMLVDERTGEARVYASGVRNPQGMIRTADDEILTTEHGPKGGDELNLIDDGEVYGWPDVTYGVGYGWKPWVGSTDQGQHEGYRKPLYAWLPSIGVSNLAEVPENAFPLWRGDLLVTSLKRQTIFRLRREPDRIVYEEPIEIGHRIRDIEALESGEFVLVTDDRKILVLLDGGPMFAKTKTKKGDLAGLMPFMVRADGVDRELSGEELFEERCAACHSLDGEVGISVPLDGLFERTVGSYRGYDYSPALARDDRVWSGRLVRQFLLHPERSFKGTEMPKANLTDRDARELVQFLKR